MTNAVEAAAANSAPPPVWHGLVAGSASGITARIAVYPADTLKARLQVWGATGGRSSARPPGALAAARQLVASEGASSLYRGMGAVLAGALPANMAYFGGFEAARRVVSPAWGLAGDMAVGALAQLAAGVVYTPLDIVKERLQVQSMMGGAYRYSSIRQAFASLVNPLSSGTGPAPTSSSSGSSGGGDPGAGTARPQATLPQQQQRRLWPAAAGGVFRGYWATNAVWLPWNILYIAGYLEAKRVACRLLGSPTEDQLPVWAVAACSALSAAAAAVVTHPADVVKTRLQVLSATPEGGGLGAWGVASGMWVREGGRAFWAGLSPRVAHIAPGCALSWALYESIKAALDERHAARRSPH